MVKEIDYGLMNGHAIGRILKEAMRRAMVAIRRERATFEATGKLGYSGNMDDVFTSADTKAQEIFLRTLRECFPGFGVIAEEKQLTICGKKGCPLYFTIDPLDGTKAFVRRQSHGFGSMIALVCRGKVLAAYVGDINSDEVYGYRPGSDTVFRITNLDTFEALGFVKPFESKKGYVLLRESERHYSPQVQNLITRQFKDVCVDGGSIGTWLARLWKREISAAVLLPSIETPWDSSPIIGISRKLGYEFYRPHGGGWEKYDHKVSRLLWERKHETLVVHEMDAAVLLG